MQRPWVSSPGFSSSPRLVQGNQSIHVEEAGPWVRAGCPKADAQLSPCSSLGHLNPVLWAWSDSSSHPSPVAKPGENPVNPRSLQCPAPASTADFCSPAIGL